MLYITTRDKFDAHTTARALHANRAEDGGFYVPFQFPVFEAEELTQFQDKSASQTIADILNLFFACTMKAWDIEFAIGRNVLQVVNLNQRVHIAELWHNQSFSYKALEDVLSMKLVPGAIGPVSWTKIAIRIAVLFAVYGELLKGDTLGEDGKIDVSVPVGDFTFVMAVWHARKMGLPVGNLICACDEDSVLWELLRSGEVKFNGEDECLPEEFERLIFGVFGADEVTRFCGYYYGGGLYTFTSEELEALREGLFAAVVSKSRMDAMISNLYRTSGYVPSAECALSYAALLDYRTKSGGRRPALIFSDVGPL